MCFSTLLLIILSVFALCGMFARSLRLDRQKAVKAVYALFCVFVLNGFVLTPIEEIALSPGCIALAAAVYSFAVIMEGTRGVFSLLAAAAASLAAALVSAGEYAIYCIYASAILAAAIVSLFKQPYTAIASAALAPLIASFAIFITAYYDQGYAYLVIGEDALASQLVGIITSVILTAVIKNSYINRRTNDRELSYERTTK